MYVDNFKVLFQHPSKFSLLNYHDEINFKKDYQGIVKDIISENPSFVEWLILKSENFCFDDYTFKMLKSLDIEITAEMEDIQKEKLLKFYDDCRKYNAEYVPIGEFSVSGKKIQTRDDSSPIGFGKYEKFSISELITISPCYLEFCINNLPNFIISPLELRMITLVNPDYVVLSKTWDTLLLKVSIQKAFSNYNY